MPRMDSKESICVAAIYLAQRFKRPNPSFPQSCFPPRKHPKDVAVRPSPFLSPDLPSSLPPRLRPPPCLPWLLLSEHGGSLCTQEGGGADEEEHAGEERLEIEQRRLSCRGNPSSNRAPNPHRARCRRRTIAAAAAAAHPTPTEASTSASRTGKPVFTVFLTRLNIAV